MTFSVPGGTGKLTFILGSILVVTTFAGCDDDVIQDEFSITHHGIVAGQVLAPSGAALEGVSVELRQVRGGVGLDQLTDAEGKFSLTVWDVLPFNANIIADSVSAFVLGVTGPPAYSVTVRDSIRVMARLMPVDSVPPVTEVTVVLPIEPEGG